MALMSAWGKTPVRCTDSPGFIVNRVNRPFTIEALRMLEAGTADVPTIDAAMRGAGFPMGPFELMDLIGIDVNLAAARGVYEVSAGRNAFVHRRSRSDLVAAGHLGRKSGEGFYRYERGRIAAGLAAVDPADAGRRRRPSTIAERSSRRSMTKRAARKPKASRPRTTSTCPGARRRPPGRERTS